MANNPKLTNLGASTEADALCPLLNSGVFNIYDGVQPATADTALGAQNLLVQLTFGATAFGAAVNGVATANAITAGTVIYEADATWFRCLESDTTTAVFDGSVGTSGCDLNLNDAHLVVGGTVSITSFTVTCEKG